MAWLIDYTASLFDLEANKIFRSNHIFPFTMRVYSDTKICKYISQTIIFLKPTVMCLYAYTCAYTYLCLHMQ